MLFRKKVCLLFKRGLQLTYQYMKRIKHEDMENLSGPITWGQYGCDG